MTQSASAPRTLYDKIFDDHVVERQEDGTCCSISTATSCMK